MVDYSAFAITGKWPPAHPERIQLYSFPTPNGVKASIALEELGLPYEAHAINIMRDDQKTPEFLDLNPNGKIPAMIDPDGPGGAPIGLFESGAILFYLAEKTGRLIPADPAARIQCLQWVFFQVGGVGPMFGQFGYFHRFAGKAIEDKRPMERYRDETKRLLGVLDGWLDGRDWMMGADCTIADIATVPWVRALSVFYEAEEMLGLDRLDNVKAWVKRAEARPPFQKGLNVPPRG